MEPKLPPLPLGLDHTPSHFLLPIRAGELVRLLHQWGREVYATGQAEERIGDVLHKALAHARARAAATDQPSAGQVDERALYDDWWHEGAHPFRDISKRKNCQLNEETAWMVWQAARASLTPTAPAPANPAALTVLQEFVDYHTKPAEMTLETAMSADKLGEFLEGVERREKAMVQRARAVLATPTAPQAAATASASDGPLSDAEFLSKRLARVAKLAGVTMPSGTYEDIAAVAGTILGSIAFNLERAALARAPLPAP